MASNGHAKLGPSAAKRWMTCPGSTRLLEAIPDLGGLPAAKGTFCHNELATILTGRRPIQPGVTATVEAFTFGYTDEMFQWVKETAGWVKRYLFAHPNARLLVETRSPVGHAFGCPDDLWGTADVVLVNDEEHELVVFDAKFGFEEVPVEGNEQVSLYAIGMCELLGWEHFDNVELVIYQPQSPEPEKVELLAIDELRARKRAYEAPVARAVRWADAELMPSDDACRWCRAQAVCPAARGEAMRRAANEFSQPELLTPEEVAETLAAASLIRSHLKAVEEWAMQQLTLGQPVPGWKRVLSNKHRQWTDESKAMAALSLLGEEKDYMTKPELKSPAQVEKSLKLEAKTLDELAPKPKGEPTLAPESDPRPAVAPDFK